MSDASAPEGLRLDKWLWAVRFFKTRQLAVEAINGGKVHLEGRRAKPGRLVHAGTRLEIHKGSLSWDIRVCATPKQRRPAPEARACYLETEESRRRREQLLTEQREQRGDRPTGPAVRPSKRDRRRLQRFTGRGT